MQELTHANPSAISTPENKIKSALRLNKPWQERIWLFLFFALLAIAITSPISSNSAIPNLADYINHLAAIIQAKIALAQGQFPLRVMPLEHNGWGYPFYQFYSPTSYTFVGLIYWLLTPSNPLIAFKIAIWCGLIIGGLSMYRLAYWFIQSKPAAILAGVVYLCAPYYIIVINHLGGLQEILALGLLPSIIYYTLQRYYMPQNNKILLQLSISLYLILTIHLVTAIYAAFLSAILLFIITCKSKHHWRNFISVGIAYAFAFLLSAWYLAPVSLLGKYFLLSGTYVDSFHLIQFHPTLSNLLFPAATLTAGYKSSALMTIHPAIGLPIVAAIGICLYAFFNHFTTGRKRADYWMPGLLVIFFIAFLMAWSPFNVWQWLPQPLLVAQYSWRLLGQVIWIGALLFAWAVYWLFKGKLDARHALLGTIFIIICVNPWFPIAENSSYDLQNFIHNPHFFYNGNEFLLNYNLYPNFVTHIDSVEVDANKLLRTNIEYSIPEPLIRLTLAPMISVTGTASNNMDLTAMLNGAPIATKIIATGPFQWNFPLEFAKNQTTTHLKFIEKNKLATASIPVQEFILNGFLHGDETLNLKQVLPFCQQQATAKSCQIAVPAGVNLLELPALYYPDMLKITLNGKTVSYDSVIYHGKLVAAITPLAGQVNNIKIEFTGLDWANKVSWLGWALCLALLLQILYNVIIAGGLRRRRRV